MDIGRVGQTASYWEPIMRGLAGGFFMADNVQKVNAADHRLAARQAALAGADMFCAARDAERDAARRLKEVVSNSQLLSRIVRG